ncbi:hypothetical protein ANN_17015 [Periplaneta americana]|uniref:Uncharacterized protein n=1 Tax=Periplaneta americana TaxID=6978 RepID=A0ABQ8SS99_PERAM|nr:hypothetical protein ANN_17015 [Periplaneta americana]
MAGLCESDNEPPGSLKTSKKVRTKVEKQMTRKEEKRKIREKERRAEEKGNEERKKEMKEMKKRKEEVREDWEKEKKMWYKLEKEEKRMKEKLSQISHSAECAPSIMAVDIGHICQHICLTWSQATKGNIEGGRFGPVLWIEFGVAQWSERLKRYDYGFPINRAWSPDSGPWSLSSYSCADGTWLYQRLRYLTCQRRIHECPLSDLVNHRILRRTMDQSVPKDLGRIDAQHAMHVTGSVNRLRPVERSQCERKCHNAMEQRANIKFCYKLGKTATETHGMLVQVYEGSR